MHVARHNGLDGAKFVAHRAVPSQRKPAASRGGALNCSPQWRRIVVDSPPSSVSRAKLGPDNHGIHEAAYDSSSSFGGHDMHSVTGSRTVDAFPILRSCRRRFSPSTSLILSIGCSRACGPSNCPFGCLGTLAPAVTQLHSMNCRKETAATYRVIRSNASQNRRSISIELCPAAVPAVDGIGQGVVVFVRLMVMPPSGDGNTCRAQRARKGGGIVWHGARARATSDPANCRCAATPAGRTPGQEMEAQRVQFRIALNAQS